MNSREFIVIIFFFLYVHFYFTLILQYNIVITGKCKNMFIW